MITNCYAFSPYVVFSLLPVSLITAQFLELQLLDQVHQAFYDAYELSQALRRPSSPVTKKGKRRPSIVDEDAPPYDAEVKHFTSLHLDNSDAENNVTLQIPSFNRLSSARAGDYPHDTQFDTIMLPLRGLQPASAWFCLQQ